MVLDLRLRDGRSPADIVGRLVAAGHPVVGCSSRDDHRWIRQAIEAGAHSYVRKTKDPTELRTAIEAAARGHRYTSSAHAAALETATGPCIAMLSVQEREALRLYAPV